MRILFMGTPDFALFSLKALVQSSHEIIGVVTQPDKPKGRGYALLPPPVKVFAEEQGIPVFQPETLKNEAFKPTLDTLNPDLIVVVAYGKILPPYVLNAPRLGCINVHGSLLPAYRGAAPMQRAIIDGQTETGVTTMYMAEGLDTGDMLEKAVIPIEESDNFETIHDKLGEAGADLLLSTITHLAEGNITPEKQDDTQSSYAAKIEKADCLLDFSKDSRTLFNQIRGLSPFPLAFTHTPDGKLLKVIAADYVPSKPDHLQNGEVYDLSQGILVACQSGSIRITALLPEGKGRMRAHDFINGRKIQLGDILH